MNNIADEFDMGAEGVGNSTPDALERLRKAIANTIAMQEHIEQMEGDLSEAKKTLQYARAKLLPDLMAEMQVDSLTHAGYEVKVSEFVSGSLPKDQELREKALEWLESHDGGELIKTDLSLSFGKSQHNEALSLVAELKDDGYTVGVTSGVHPQTLQKYGRDRIHDGEEIDTELLGLFVGQIAKIKRVEK